jgi:hypothetical protein
MYTTNNIRERVRDAKFLLVDQPNESLENQMRSASWYEVDMKYEKT